MVMVTGFVFFMCKCNYHDGTSDHNSASELFIKHVVNSMRFNYAALKCVPGLCPRTVCVTCTDRTNRFSPH